MCPKSPRFLISKDRHEEAIDILVKYHAKGDCDLVFVEAEMAQIKTTLEARWRVQRNPGLICLNMLV